MAVYYVLPNVAANMFSFMKVLNVHFVLDANSLSKCLMNKYLQFFISDANISHNKFEQLLTRTQTHLGIVLDGDCEDWNLIINENTDKQYFYETYHWLVTSNTENITKDLSQLKLNINADVNLVPLDSYTESNETYIIYDIYNPASEHGGELKIEKIGFYKTGREYAVTNLDNKYFRRRNMTGTRFKSAVVVPDLHQPLQEYLARDDNRQIDSMHRFQAVTVQHCRHLYNFSLDIERTPSWGYVQPNGKFDGLVSLLERRLVDFGSSPLLFKLDRMPFVDYGYGNWILRSYFIYRRPKTTATSYEIFLRPLDEKVWILILLTLGIVMILMKIIFSSEVLLLREKEVRLEDTTWSFLALFAFGAFCQQGTTLLLSSSSNSSLKNIKEYFKSTYFHVVGFHMIIIWTYEDFDVRLMLRTERIA